MEDRARFIERFSNNSDMIDLFNDSKQRLEAATKLYQERWENATVTVKKLNGEMFFID